MTELELFDKVNPRRDLPQATCDVISQVYKVMNLETEQLKQQIEKEKKFSKDVMNNELRLIKQIEKMKNCYNCKHFSNMVTEETCNKCYQLIWVKGILKPLWELAE